MNSSLLENLLLFSLEPHPLAEPLSDKIGAKQASFDTRLFPDGESYLRLEQEVTGMHCILLADLSHPNKKYLPLIFLLDTLKELGAASVGLVAPYLSYMRQDRRFVKGEAITSKLFARALSQHIDWLVTIDPHLHRYHSLNEIYSVYNRVVQGSPALSLWLENQRDLLLVGPDAESEQWVADIAAKSGHPFTIGAKNRYGDKEVEVTLQDLSQYTHSTAVIIDDVISSGQTIKQCIAALKKQNIQQIKCAAIHGIFSEQSDIELINSGLLSLVTSNTIPHDTNEIDVADLLVSPIIECILAISKNQQESKLP